MTTVEAIEHHHRQVVQRTAFSLVCYGGFVVTSLISAVRRLALEDPTTLIAIGLAILAFLILPRDYVPALLVHKAKTDEEQLRLEALRRHQRFGLIIRGTYAVGAIVTIVAVPRLMAV